MADPDVAGRAILTRDYGIEVDCADIALRCVVEIVLEELVQVVGEKRRKRRRGDALLYPGARTRRLEGRRHR
ncbi:hypothetical protein ACCS53_39745, partial [Rhizobium ruizarguesonis]